MSILLENKDRRIIPRWRNYRTTSKSGVLNGDPLGSPPPLLGEDTIKDKIEIWEATRSEEYAADLVSAAFVLGQYHFAKDAAKFLLRQSSDATESVKLIAKLVLGLKLIKDEDLEYKGFGDSLEIDNIRATINSLKFQLNKAPRNSLLWSELSRAYILLGQSKQSIKSIENALYLAPFNRYILRSASRLFVHLHEPDRANELLANNERTVTDPWLLAAEISTAGIAGRKSRNIRSAKRLLRSGRYPPFHITELASALATIDLYSGSDRTSRKLFKESLIDPTENSVAQASWASRKIPGIEVSEELLTLPQSYEVRAWTEYYEQKWEESVQQSIEWLLDEPFSSRPAEFGSYVAAIGLENYILCEDFSRRGLIANPDDTVLLNNLIYALANQGRLVDADHVLRSIPRPIPDKSSECALLATEGLIAFREGNPYEGRSFYRKALDLAVGPQLKKTRILASIHLALEESRINSIETNDSIQAALAESEGMSSPEISWLKDILLSRN